MIDEKDNTDKVDQIDVTDKIYKIDNTDKVDKIWGMGHSVKKASRIQCIRICTDIWRKEEVR